MNNFNTSKINQLLDNIWNNKFKDVLKETLLSIDESNNDIKIITAWALIEEGYAHEALNLINKADYTNFNSFHNLIIGYILSKVSKFQDAEKYISLAIEQKTDYPLWARILYSRIKAYLNEYYEAYHNFNEATSYISSLPSELEYLKKLFSEPSGFLDPNIFTYPNNYLLKQAQLAYEKSEYWYTLWALDSMLNNALFENYYTDCQKLKILTLNNLYQFDVLSKIFDNVSALKLNTKELKELSYKISQKYELSITPLDKIIKKYVNSSNEQVTISKLKDFKKDEKHELYLSHDNLSNTVLSENEMNSLLSLNNDYQQTEKIIDEQNIKVIDIKIHNLLDSLLNDNRVYLSQITSDIKYIGVDIFIENLSINNSKSNLTLHIQGNCDNNLYDSKALIYQILPNWKYILFETNLGQDNSLLKGNELTIIIKAFDKEIFQKSFKISNSDVEDTFELNYNFIRYSKENIQYSNEEIILDEEKLKQSEIDLILKELDVLIGLSKVKSSIRDFATYLEYINERKKLGIKTSEDINYHCVFLGNPGTGKTTVARILAKIFKAMGILNKGHFIETDRAGLVGQYVGETAQKTDKLIQEALGGVLFIDEAYTLSPKNNNQDFGKEAIDILLKRMEDLKGQFIVIVAGYPEEMKSFLEANPGLKSRFNHYFDFEDYNPDELITIFQHYASKEEYKISEEVIPQLHKYFNEVYRNRDNTFGNARLVRNIFEEIKLNVSKRYLQTPPDLRKPELMTTILLSDIQTLVKPKENKTYKIAIDEEELNKELAKLNELIGLDSVKLTIERLISSLKVAKIREAQGLKVIRKSLHSVFLGNPGTGKTTVARQLSRIFKVLGFLEKGHLVEVDRSKLVAGYVGQTAAKTDEVIQKSLGGTLFIDEAYTLVRSNNDFGIEAVETLLKRMEDYKEDFVVIVAGYPDEMKKFLETNPGLQSRFTNYLNFEDYTPRQMLEIALSICEKSGYKLDEGAWQLTYEIFEKIYNNRDKNFGNARTVQNFIHKAIANQEERIIREGKTSKEDLILILYEDIEQIDAESILF
jgi:SpoVK/Ycf46/Vps4 family AAA+-type ATPase